MNRKYTCKICAAEFEHDSDEPLDACLKCSGDGEENWHWVEYRYRCPFCDVWMEYDLLDETNVCSQCDSSFEDEECIDFTLKCLALYNGRDAQAKARRCVEQMKPNRDGYAIAIICNEFNIGEEL